MSADAVLDPLATVAAARAFQYYRRDLREDFDGEDMESYSTAKALEEGSDLDGSDIEDVVRGDDYRLGEDPLLDVVGGLPFKQAAISFSTNLTWNNLPGERGVDRRAKLSCYVRDLGLETPVAQYLKAISGPHYDAHTDKLKIAVDKHVDVALNKREALEQLVACVVEAKRLSSTHGPFKQRQLMPAYSH